MSYNSKEATPNSPETQPQQVRQQLHQDDVTHKGSQRPAGAQDEEAGAHMGAEETEMTPVTPPMAGPADLVGDSDTPAADDMGVEPAEELHGG